MKEKIKLLFKEYLEIILSILSIIAFFFDYWDKFIKFNFSLSIIQIFLLILFSLLIIKIILEINKKSIKQLQAENFYRNWIEFKNILIKYKNWKNISNTEYEKNRKILLQDISFFMKDFIEIRKIKDWKYNWALPEYMNLKECVSFNKLEDINKRIPEDFDIFDVMILELRTLYK